MKKVSSAKVGQSLPTSSKLGTLFFGTRPVLSISKNVALVGNSDIILNKRYGKQIDKYSTVIRFNFADIKPAHTGKKTTIRWINCPINMPSVREHNNDVKTPTQYKKYVHGKINGVSIVCWPSLTKKLRPICPKTKFYRPNGMCTPQNINKYLDEIKIKAKLEVKKDSWPRTGMHAILTCIRSGCKPHLYGFDFKKRDVIQHYSKNTKYDVSKISCHQVHKEIDIINELEKKGLIVIHR